MRGNTQFPVASHILALVGMVEHFENRMPTSKEIASSVNTNPVVIRRIIGLLKNSSLVHVRAGVGGVQLLRKPSDISLLDIYKAVQSEESPSVFDFHANVNLECPIGSQINGVLSDKFQAAQIKLENELSQHTLEDVMKEIAQKNNVSME